MFTNIKYIKTCRFIILLSLSNLNDNIISFNSNELKGYKTICKKGIINDNIVYFCMFNADHHNNKYTLIEK